MLIAVLHREKVTACVAGQAPVAGVAARTRRGTFLTSTAIACRRQAAWLNQRSLITRLTAYFCQDVRHGTLKTPWGRIKKGQKTLASDGGV